MQKIKKEIRKWLN